MGGVLALLECPLVVVIPSDTDRIDFLSVAAGKLARPLPNVIDRVSLLSGTVDGLPNPNDPWTIKGADVGSSNRFLVSESLPTAPVVLAGGAAVGFA